MTRSHDALAGVCARVSVGEKRRAAERGRAALAAVTAKRPASVAPRKKAITIEEASAALSYRLPSEERARIEEACS